MTSLESMIVLAQAQEQNRMPSIDADDEYSYMPDPRQYSFDFAFQNMRDVRDMISKSSMPLGPLTGRRMNPTQTAEYQRAQKAYKTSQDEIILNDLTS